MAAVRRKLDALLGIDAAALEAERAAAEEERVRAAAAAEAEAQRGQRREASRAGRAREAAAAAKQRAEIRVKSEARAGRSGGGDGGGAAAAADGGAGPEERLRRMMSFCKWARIQFPPGKSRTIENAEAVLQKHGLCERSSKTDIKAVRARLQQEREMDGIDAGNIVEGRRGPRAPAGSGGANPYAETRVKPEPKLKPEPGRSERAPLGDHARPAGPGVSTAPAQAVKGVQGLRQGKENGALEAGAPPAPAPGPLAGACADWEDDDDF